MFAIKHFRSLSKIQQRVLCSSSDSISFRFFRSVSSADDASSNLTTKRCILYVPANDPKKLSKIFDSSADCIVLDCEDGVALNRKLEARNNIKNLFSTDQRVQSDLDGRYSVRINSTFSQLAEDDINTLFDANATNRLQLPKCLFVPKTNSGQEIKWLYEKIYANVKSISGYNRLSLFFYMESALSLLNLPSIIETAIETSTSKYRSLFKLEGFVFGSDDYCADIAAARTKDASELAYARQKLVSVCKAYKLQVIDMVYIDYKDLDGLRQQSEQGFRIGFTGKQVIHPGQVDVTQQAYTPSKERIEWAQGLIQAFDEHQTSGKGAFTYKGSMIDMPSLLQAKNIINLANRINKKN